MTDPRAAEFAASREDLLESIFGGGEEGRLARAAYGVLLPNVALSRSPLTGDVVAPRFDAVDLNGVWWDAYDPVRGTVDLPPDVISFTGAMRLAAEVSAAPFLASPGPSVPFVKPDLLELDGVVAVVSQVAVGRHTGYPIFYFAEAFPEDHDLLLDWWGARAYRYGSSDHSVEGLSPGFEGDFDFSLEPWVASGKLLWIAPDDPSLSLQRGVGGCAYLGLDGERRIARVENGEVWWSPEG